MATIVVPNICTATVNAVTLDFENPGSVTFTIPQDKDHVMDRAALTSAVIKRPEEPVTVAFTALYHSGQVPGDFWADLDGTKDATFVETAASKTHTFYGVVGSCDFSEDDAGSPFTLNMLARGYSDGTNTYGVQG